MQLHIKIDCEISDPHTESEIVDILNRILPWMSDNVKVYSSVEDNDESP